MGKSWGLSKELSLWVARRLNQDSIYELPDIFDMTCPTREEKMVFVGSVLGIEYVGTEYKIADLIAAIDVVKPGIYCE